MNSFYQVIAQFDDGESLSYILIGNFTDLDVAQLYKDKWDNFFNINKQLLQEPQGWDPSKDEWVRDDYEPEWYDSKEYYTLLAKWGSIKDFVQIDINELGLNQEVFMNNNHNMWYGPMIQLMTQFDRDWKINQMNGSQEVTTKTL